MPRLPVIRPYSFANVFGVRVARFMIVACAMLGSRETEAQATQSRVPPEPTTTYAFTLAVPMVECDFAGTPKRGSEQQAPNGGSFYYVQTVRDTVVIQFVQYDPKEQKAQFTKFNAVDDQPTTPRKFFCITQSVFNQFTRQSFAWGRSSHEFVVGALLLPIKLRRSTGGADFDFSNDISFGTSAGWRWRLSPFRETFVNLLGGIALSSVSLTAENTANSVPTTTDRAAFTWTGGLMFQANRFQIGAFVGEDRISQPKASNWAFHGKTWIALGLGYTLFGAAASDQPVKEQRK